MCVCVCDKRERERERDEILLTIHKFEYKKDFWRKNCIKNKNNSLFNINHHFYFSLLLSLQKCWVKLIFLTQKRIILWTKSCTFFSFLFFFMHIKCILSVQMDRKIDEKCVSESLFLSGKRKRKNATYIFVCATKKCKKCLSFCLASQSQGKLVTFLNWTTFFIFYFFLSLQSFCCCQITIHFFFFLSLFP